MAKKIIIRCIVVIICTWCIYQGACYIHWFLMAWSGPGPRDKIVAALEEMPTQQVIKKLHSVDIFSPYPQTAISVLADRKDKSAVPSLIRLLKVWNPHIRRDAIWALGVIDDSRAIEPLMDIVKSGEKNSDYVNALSALSKMRYEGAYNYVVERAKEPDAYRNGSVEMLKNYGKPESIALLLEIKNNIKDSDPMAKAGRIEIDKVISYIEALK